MSTTTNTPPLTELHTRHSGLPSCVLQRLGHDWRLCGRGMYVWTVFRCYWASLYTPNGAFDEKSPAILDLSYLRTISKEQTVSISVDEMLRLHPELTEHAHRWREELSRIIPDVKLGDRLVGYFDPAYGASFFSDQQALGEVVDPEFAGAFLSIWLHPATRANALREALLGGAQVAHTAEVAS